MRTKQSGSEKGKVLDIEAYRSKLRRVRIPVSEPRAMATKKKDEDRDLLDGQQTIYRGNLYVHIDDAGQVDFDICSSRTARRPCPRDGVLDHVYAFDTAYRSGLSPS